MIPQNPYKSKDDRYTIQLGLQKIAWQVCKETHIAWLLSPCTEHPDVIDFSNTRQGLRPYRYKCPECMKELEVAQ